MIVTFAALRSALYAAGFFALWAWVASLLRPCDDALGGTLPAWSRPVAFLALACGAAIATWCIGSFAIIGRGTPALFDPPRKFVARGPYRYVRNPMYIGAGLLLLGFGLYQRSPAIALFVPVWWLLFHLLVILYEEPALHFKFGPDYDQYLQRTPRWIPSFIRPTSTACATALVLFGCADLWGVSSSLPLHRSVGQVGNLRPIVNRPTGSSEPSPCEFQPAVALRGHRCSAFDTT